MYKSSFYLHNVYINVYELKIFWLFTVVLLLSMQKKTNNHKLDYEIKVYMLL